MIGTLERVPLRQVWKNEATDFTRWLQENIDILNEVLDFTLSNPEREQAAGSFSVDLVAEDESGNTIIIENQLEKSDHDHLGKVITYLTSFDAKAAIWIVAKARPEHVNAVSWLNESSSANFYLLQLEAVRIEGSPPAALLTLIVGPSQESKDIGEKKKELAERYVKRRQFWERLLARAKSRTQLHSRVSPSKDNWISTGAGKSGLSLNYVIRKADAHVELYIDRGKECDDENIVIFDDLLSHKEQIETSFGEPLEWQRLEGKRGCRIKRTIAVGGYANEETWTQTQDAMIDAMIRLEKAFRPYIERIK